MCEELGKSFRVVVISISTRQRLNDALWNRLITSTSEEFLQNSKRRCLLLSKSNFKRLKLLLQANDDNSAYRLSIIDNYSIAPLVIIVYSRKYHQSERIRHITPLRLIELQYAGLNHSRNHNKALHYALPTRSLSSRDLVSVPAGVRKRFAPIKRINLYC